MCVPSAVVLFNIQSVLRVNGQNKTPTKTHVCIQTKDDRKRACDEQHTHIHSIACDRRRIHEFLGAIQQFHWAYTYTLSHGILADDGNLFSLTRCFIHCYGPAHPLAILS